MLFLTFQEKSKRSVVSPWTLARRLSDDEVLRFSANVAEGGGAHLHRDADCGAAQVANRRRKRKGKLRASASRPLVQRLHDSPGILMRDSRPPARKEAH